MDNERLWRKQHINDEKLWIWLLSLDSNGEK